MHTPDHNMDGMKLSHLRKELKSIRKEYYKPLSKMSRQELMDEHSRHKGLAAGKTSMPEPMPPASLEKKIVNAHVNIKKHKVIPGLPQAMGSAVAAETQEGGKALGEPSPMKMSKKILSESHGKVERPNVQDMPKAHKAVKKHTPEHESEKHHSSEVKHEGGKKVSSYNSFVGTHRREGKSMKEIAEMWHKTKK